MEITRLPMYLYLNDYVEGYDIDLYLKNKITAIRKSLITFLPYFVNFQYVSCDLTHICYTAKFASFNVKNTTSHSNELSVRIHKRKPLFVNKIQ